MEDRSSRHQGKKRFRLDMRGGRKAGGKAEGPDAQEADEEGTDWE